MKIARRQIVFLLVIVAVNAIMWIVPSDIVEAVARDRDILLGRYTRQHFTWILALIPVSAVALYIGLAGQAAVRKVRTFRLIAVLLALVPSLLAVDIYLRLTTQWHYVIGRLTYHRTPDLTLKGLFHDAPEAARTYLNVPPGYGTIQWTLTTDRRGYRNPAALDQCDVVALGDSFTEGSQMSDDQPWPARLAAMRGAPVYNLGVSGYAPQNSLAALREYGLALKPRWVFLLLYEGNDFKQAKVTTEAPSEWQRFFKRSPLVRAADGFLVRTLGPIGARRPRKELEVLSWLPLAVPPGADARYYAFPPNMLVDHYVLREEFERGKEWARMRPNLDQMRLECERAGARFAVVYAPTKAHVVLPVVKDALPADNVRAFVALRADRALPDPDTFLTELLADLDVRETVTRQWCDANSVPLISLTEPLREAARAGTQVYFTYNDHWAPPGHEVAARAVHGFLSQHENAP